MTQALGIEPARPERLAVLWDKETRAKPLAPDVDALKAELLANRT